MHRGSYKITYTPHTPNMPHARSSVDTIAVNLRD